MDTIRFNVRRSFGFWNWNLDDDIFSFSHFLFLRNFSDKCHTKETGVSEASWSRMSLILNCPSIKTFTMTNILNGGYQ